MVPVDVQRVRRPIELLQQNELLMSEIIKQIMSIGVPFNMIVLVVGIGSLCTLLGTLAMQVRIFANHRAEVQLKRELVERGLSVDEIERVIHAKSPEHPTNT